VLVQEEDHEKKKKTMHIPNGDPCVYKLYLCGLLAHEQIASYGLVDAYYLEGMCVDYFLDTGRCALTKNKGKKPYSFIVTHNTRSLLRLA
jgi:hypothetical protein